MASRAWDGVIPAITTPFRPDLSVDVAFLATHVEWLVDSGCSGVVVCGSLGEAATLSHSEKLEVLRTCRETLGPDGFVATAVSALSTAEAVQYARDAARAGASGLMILPPYAYSTDWREMRAHVATVLAATELPCMLYNNPVAYRTDFLPEQIADLADAFPQLTAVKESSTDIRRITALRVLLGTRLSLAVGVDDLAVEAAAMGVDGWIAGVVNALPRESVQLFDLARSGAYAEALEIYRWMLPLLRMDTVPKFVQLIKLVQERCGMGSALVRPPRLELDQLEREEALRVVDECLRARQALVVPAR